MTVIRAVIFRSKNQITNGTTTLIPVTTQLMRAPAPGAVASQHVDLHKVDLLYDQTWVLGPTAGSNQKLRHAFQVNLQINKTHYFDSDNSGIFKDKQYYMAFVAQNGGVPSPGFLDFEVAMNFKDL